MVAIFEPVNPWSSERLERSSRFRADGGDLTDRALRFDLLGSERPRTVQTPGRATEHWRRDDRRDWPLRREDADTRRDEQPFGPPQTYTPTLATSDQIELWRAFSAWRGEAGGSDRRHAEPVTALRGEGTTRPGEQTPSWRLHSAVHHARPTGYGAGRSVSGAQTWYTPTGRTAGYPDFVERTTTPVYGGIAVIRLSDVGLALSGGAPPQAFGLA